MSAFFAHNFSLVGRILIILWFYESLEKTDLDGTFNSELLIGPNFELFSHL